MSKIPSFIIDGMTWSYSRLETFHRCRYAWISKYLYNSAEDPMFYASYGSLIHKIIENFYNNKISRSNLKEQFYLGFLNDIIGKVRTPQTSIVNSYIQKGIEYLDNFESFPYEMIAVEKKVDFVIEGYNFTGYIDFLGEKDGEYYIVDNKSRDLKPRSNRKKPTVKDQELDEMLRQLYLYAAAIKQEYGKFPKSLCFNCFKSGIFIEEPFNIDAYNEAIHWALDTINDIKNEEEFLPSVEYFGCNWICGLGNECCYKN